MKVIKRIYSSFVHYVANPIVLVFARRAHIVVSLILSFLFLMFVSPILMKHTPNIVGNRNAFVNRIFGLTAFVQNWLIDQELELRHPASVNILVRILYIVVKITTMAIDVIVAFPIGLVSVVVCLLVNWALLVGHGCSTGGVQFLSYKSFFWIGTSYVGGAIENLVVIFFSSYIVTLIILRPFGRWIVVPSVLNIWWFFSIGRRKKMKRTDREEVERYVPKEFDKRKIEMGLQRYRSDQNLLSVYVSRLADEFRAEQEIKFIQKQMDLLRIQRSYLEEVIAAEKAKDKFGRLEKEKELEEKRLESEIKRMDREIELADLEREAQVEELKTRIAKAKLARENIGKEKDEKRNIIEDIVNKVKMQAISIVKAKEEIREMFADNPELVEAMLDRFERELVEKGISGGD